ncbi:YlxM family DNA-binding protein [Herbivorax sp. ANBcel31]|uniref:YlxM family DNA-binding protein n=1 Tax=Herbivorax sp. ANBcel31 TaxID=3069754 RepID=UPI0027AE1D74|nr:YlxM family DNA-binding protein [Herbivorax sp. ANBcel31]MDQ2087015.1 YlxM family DNA-binding protein [Herbivorax sp. ANBcel31]
MDNIYEMAMLLDFYGQMLTKRQFEIMDLHFNSDYSLGEIAQQLNISRQGVYDNVKRCKALLNEMEKKLGLLNRFAIQKDKEEKILTYLKNINKSNMSEEDISILKIVEEEISKIIES